MACRDGVERGAILSGVNGADKVKCTGCGMTFSVFQWCSKFVAI